MTPCGYMIRLRGSMVKLVSLFSWTVELVSWLGGLSCDLSQKQVKQVSLLV